MRIIERGLWNCSARADYPPAPEAPCFPRDDDHSVGRINDRFVLLIPPNAVVLVVSSSEQLDDFSAARRLAVHSACLNPIADVRVRFLARGHS